MHAKRWIRAQKAKKIGYRQQKEQFLIHRPDHADIRAREGRELEERVAALLARKKELDSITDFVQHMPCSAEDRLGHDFSIVVGDHKLSFGITSSFNSYKRYFQKHPGQECLLIPMSSTEEEIWFQIQNLLLRQETT